MNKYDAILFDFDGVLADTEPLHFASYGEALAPLGVTLEWEYYRVHCLGVSDEEMLRELARLQKPPLPFEILWACYPMKREIFRRRSITDPPIPETTRSYIRSLRNYRLAVVSSSDRSEVEPLLEAAGILECMSATVFGNDVERLKPSPDPYLEAARRIGSSSPLVLEDSPAGIASGRAAGFDVLVVETPQKLAQQLEAYLADGTRSQINF